MLQSCVLTPVIIDPGQYSTEYRILNTHKYIRLMGAKKVLQADPDAFGGVLKDMTPLQHRSIIEIQFRRDLAGRTSCDKIMQDEYPGLTSAVPPLQHSVEVLHIKTDKSQDF